MVQQDRRETAPSEFIDQVSKANYDLSVISVVAWAIWLCLWACSDI